MKQIVLVPVDFSNCSLIAARYAVELARHMRMDVHILHAYRPFTSAFQSQRANETDEQRARLTAGRGLAEFSKKLYHGSDVSVTVSIEESGTLKAVTEYTEGNNVCLVVMGTHGSSGRRKDLLGSNTYDVAKDVPRPLLIVPENTSSFKAKNVVFFSDYQQGDIKSLTSLFSLFGDILLSYTLVHIHEKKNGPGENDQRQLEQWKSLLERETPVNNLGIEIAHAPENAKAVEEILERLCADMTLITLVDTKNFFERLFHKSLARAIILNPKSPVLLTSGDTK